MNLRRTAALAAALTLFAAACGGDDDGPDSAPATEAPAATDLGEQPAGAAIGLATSDLGEVIVDADGNTLYLFVPDAQGDSTCYDQCEANWPVVGEVTEVGDGLDAALLGTTERTTGDVQATYNGWPLYYFANDAAAGDTNGQGVGDVWYVIDAAGDAISR